MQFIVDDRGYFGVQTTDGFYMCSSANGRVPVWTCSGKETTRHWRPLSFNEAPKLSVSLGDSSYWRAMPDKLGPSTVNTEPERWKTILVSNLQGMLDHELPKLMNSLRRVLEQEEYIHVKTGGRYRVINDGCLHEETGERQVIYQSLLDGQVWVRPHSKFFDGRFMKASQPTITPGNEGHEGQA